MEAYRVAMQTHHVCTLSFMEMGAIQWATILRIFSSMSGSLVIWKPNQQMEVLFLGMSKILIVIIFLLSSSAGSHFLCYSSNFF